MKLYMTISLLVFSVSTLFSQELKISNGVSIPAKGEIRVFLVFAEIDYADGPCPCNDAPDNIGPSSTWPDIDGKTQVPKDAHTYFNPDMASFLKDPAFITGLYYESSFGEYKLFGDYYPEVITIPCNEIKQGGDGVNAILAKLDEKPSEDGTLYTASGLSLKDFDQWTPTSTGLPKINKPDGKVDIFYIIWKNNRFIHTCNTGDNSGYGLSSSKGIKFKDMAGVNTRSSFNASASAPHGYNVTLYEFMHGTFGGNHWHSGGGAGIHTFIAVPQVYGLTAQYGRTMNSSCAWDRWMMDYKNPEKKFLISAVDAKRKKEVDTETISQEKYPDGGTFILRDYVTTGDAIRIKLPHIDYEKDGVKNQYLWLENHRMNSRYENYTEAECSNRGNFNNGPPGIYAYIQVGKDVKTGGKEIYSSHPLSHPNALGSYLMPFSAEGNFDFCYRFDLIQEPSWICGNWNNRNIPKDRKCNKPNPFTGFSDCFQSIDSNNDGKLYSGDHLILGLSEVVDSKEDCFQDLQENNICHNFNGNGDWEDVYSKATGKTKISLSTNPAPVPVYTYSSVYSYSGPNTKDPAAYENRTIWLNGLSIVILDEDVKEKKHGKGAMRIQIKWDDYDVEEDVRWCGNIKLSPHYKNSSPVAPGKVSLNLKKGKTILLDRGESPTFYVAVETDSVSGKHHFTEPSVFECLPGSYFKMEEQSTLNLINKSTMVVRKGSKLEVSPNAKIVIGNGSKLIIEKGAEFSGDQNRSILTTEGGKIIFE